MKPALLWLIPAALCAQSLQDFEKKVTEFTLANGLHFIIVERHNAPVVSFISHVNAGSVNDPSGATGIAHMFEHMAFKGTDSIGSKNWLEEKKSLDGIEAVYDRLDQERRKGRRADPKQIEMLEAELKKAIEKADSFVDQNAFDRLVEANGGVGMNAGTGMDSTSYQFNFPANRLELWFLLESERFKKPVYREFYKERDVVREERRMRVESSPQGKLLEAMISSAFSAHPYKNMPGGWATDIENFRRRDAEDFYKKYYVPGNITVAIVGDVNPNDAKRYADKYFSSLPRGPLPPPVITVEPPQEGEKRIEVVSPAQPFVAIGYKRPDQYHADDAALDILNEVLASGRTSILYKELVRDKKIALFAGSISTFPGSKYPNLFLFYVFPNQGKTIEENEKACHAIVERMKKEKVDQASLDRVKTKLRAALIRKLDNNYGLAGELSSYHANFGDWRKLFTALDELNKVTLDDVQRVARTYLKETTRTVAYTVAPKPEGK